VSELETCALTICICQLILYSYMPINVFIKNGNNAHFAHNYRKMQIENLRRLGDQPVVSPGELL